MQAQRADGTASTYDLYIQPNGGNIGINNTSPDGKLAILHTLNSAYATTSRNNTFLQIRNDSTTSGCYAGIEIAAQGSGNDSITQLTTVDTGSGNTDFVIGLRSSSTFTEKARFQNGGGVSFNGDTAAANALNDYEEGNWTPSISSGGWTGLNVGSAKYVKIGAQVFVQCFVDNLTGSGSSADLQLGSLPFTSISSGYVAGSVDIGQGSVKGVYIRTESNDNKISFYYPSENNSTSRVALNGNQIGSAYIILGLTYFTNS